MMDNFKICVLFNVMLQLSCTYGIDFNTIQQSALDFGRDLASLAQTASSLEKVVQLYDDHIDELTFGNVNGEQIVSELADKLGQVLKKKMDALKDAVEFAEKKAAKYKWNSELELEKVNKLYVHSKRVNDSEAGYEYDAQFQQRVNNNVSSVHIPVEIYEGDIEILNGLLWTNELDEIWIKNKEADPDLIWQYFGSQTGIMRIYPASKWRGDAVDLYDVRRRPWYTQGASSPKDMFILVDTSGSTQGQALALMKQSVRSLIDTLGENDFVNIAYFSNEAHPISTCFDGFVQASHWNKQALYEAVDSLKAKNMADYTAGFKFAFEQFELWNETESATNQGAACNQIIMFLTDGGTDHAEEVFKKYNDKKTVRVFSYAVGPTANPINAPTWIACSNRGYFYKIPAMGAIRSAVQSVPTVLVRPMALAGYAWKRWSAVYKDQYGMGMMTTVTLPVYNRTADSTNQTILGVMGSDVTVSEMEQYIAQNQLGPNGYAFAINSNGYIVFHPNLQAVKGYVDNPPNVDLLDVEVPSAQKEEMRRSMIDLERGSVSLTDYVLHADQRHIETKIRVYYYTAIPDSTFSLAVVLPPSFTRYIDSVADTSSQEGTEALKEGTSAVLTAPWQFCSNISTPDNETTEMEMFIDAILNNPDSCNDELLKRLFYDAKVTVGMDSHWSSSAGVEQVSGVFVATEGGLTRVYPPSARDHLEPLRDTVNEVFYRRSLDTSDWIYSAPYHADDRLGFNTTDPVVMATKAIKFSSEQYSLAVVGVLLSQETLLDKLTSHVECTADEWCYVLDDAGYLIVSSQEDDDQYVGKPFEEIEPLLMHHLWQDAVYVQNEQYDYQGVCEIQEPADSAGFRSVVPPFIFEVLSINWWSSNVMWAYMNFNIATWAADVFSSLQYQADAAGDGEGDASLGNKSCINHLAQYSLSAHHNAHSSVLCGNCSRQLTTARIAESNLVLVVVSKDCEGNCDKRRVFRGPDIDVLDPSFVGECNVTRRYRRRPDSCYDFNPDEDTDDCGAAMSLLGCTPLLIGSLVVTIVTLLSNTAT